MPRKPSRAKALGVDQEDYDRMLAEQDGHCALCPNEPKTRRLHVDHDHKTGAVRGLLCYRCNRALPTYVSAIWLQRAAFYVAKGNGVVAEDYPVA
jgi:Recombination endonuclease VII